MSRLGLHMIVKDEAHVIERCLRSVLPLIDWWVISDTGSTDGTQDVVRRVLADVPGTLIERPWVSFGHNRQEALDAARELEHAQPDDYTIWIDADDELVDVPAELPDLTDDGYYLEVEYGGVRFRRLTIVRLDRPWRWEGPVHEYLDFPEAKNGMLPAPRVKQYHEGARARDPETYRKDAALLEAHLEKHPDDPRTQYYLGQSWRDAGEYEKALEAFRLRVANPSGWDQERWYAQYMVGRLLIALGRPQDEAATALVDAYAARPNRAEPLVDLSDLERQRGRYAVALIYARAASLLPYPGPAELFVDQDAYTWRIDDEIAVSCYWTGQYAEGMEHAQKALAVRPDDERLITNVGFFKERLG
ncbi:glycosyltransferase [Nocardioides sp. SR21]|uniref:tetratricopeptide repeat-containing glycosyltransferase n=1 Tax=Nocardioides sp. SR21 TaxID=2919501 RepID=UPI001FAA769B|nr:glycosyltransferase [Nocardioides sp. SR21]